MKSVGILRAAIVLSILCLSIPRASAGGLTQEESDLFEKYVRPTFIAHCIKCHGETKQENGLRLTSMEGLHVGGIFGAVVVPGKPEESSILGALRYESYEMPPSGQLDKETVEGIEKWIAAGAPWPKGVVLKPAPKITAEDRDWWCYQPILDPEVPKVDDGGWCRNSIDQFLFARLAAEEIAPSEEAPPLVLARRLSYTLTGLPPDEATIAIAADGFSEGEYEVLVERLLDDPAYGQNQARYWLDLVRYADSDGYRADHSRPEAHRYRDYVVDSYNSDKPYDRFVLEQLAGDEIDPGNPDAITATMYLRHWIYEYNQRDVEGQWDKILNDITETTADAFMAQGVKCARCHDHKFDPILQKDYYRLQAFFEPFQPREDLQVADLATQKKHREQMLAWKEATEEIRRRIYEIERPVLLDHASGQDFGMFVVEIREMMTMWPADRTPYEHQIASLAARQLEPHPDKIYEWLDGELEAEHKKLTKKLAEFDSLKPEPLPTRKFVASDVGPVAPPTFIPGQEKLGPIKPGFLTILDKEPAQIAAPPKALQSTGRRTALAKWLIDPENPLTARVMVNRIWQQHFGRGLVDTPSDFGRLGQPPSHPQLLDWLASRFVEDGWSVKAMHHRIVTSAAFRQQSRRPGNPHVNSIDPANRLLWRMNPRRLTGEELIDTVLAASGEIEELRRAIYKPIRRNSLDPVLRAFDFPLRITSTCIRYQSTTATQALLMANGEWARERAMAIAARLAGMVGESAAVDTDFVHQAYLALFAREPAQEEIDFARQFIDQYSDRTPREPTPPDPTQLVEMPSTGGKAVNLKPNGRLKLGVKNSDQLPSEDFTIETVVLLRSLYEDASVRTIVTHWNGNTTQKGWSLGVTSKKSSYQPRNLILQIVGKTEGGEKPHYEVIPSGLRPELNRPYYLAVSVDLDDTAKGGITFFMKDLSDPNAKMQVAHVKHSVTHDIRPDHDLQIGGRFGHHRWDGLIDSLRIRSGAIALGEEVAKTNTPSSAANTLVNWRFENPDKIGLDSSQTENHAWIKVQQPDIETPHEKARVAFIHALLNSNELIYVD